MKTVLVDLDGVVVDYYNGLFAKLIEKYPDFKVPEFIENYKIKENFEIKDDLRKIEEIKRMPGLFKDLPIMNDAIDGIKRIIDLGYYPQICSAPFVKNPTCKFDKLHWIDQNLVPIFGNFILEDAIITSSKYKVPGIALIDDRPNVKNYQKATWKQIVFDHPYNKKTEQKYRLYGWQDPNLENLLKQCEE